MMGTGEQSVYIKEKQRKGLYCWWDHVRSRTPGFSMIS